MNGIAKPILLGEVKDHLCQMNPLIIDVNKGMSKGNVPWVCT